MAVRRKYRCSPRYRDGGAVPLAFEIVVEPSAASPESSPASSVDGAPQIEEESPLQVALRATMVAEGLHREALRHQREMQAQPAPMTPPPSLERYVDLLPLSDHKKQFLKANPTILEPDQSKAVAAAYHEAIRIGIADDFEQMNRYLLESVQRDQDELPPAPQPMEPEQQLTAPAPQRRPSMPMSAPVSRGDVAISDGRQLERGITLSPEERSMAHLSYRDLSPHEAERIYARMKAKLATERAAGRYPERERG